MSFGLEQEGGSLTTPMALAHPIVDEKVPKSVGWTMCFLLMTFVPAQKLCVNIYIYICVCVCVHS